MNRPITLWLLSTVAVGILTFTYSQYSACRASFAIDSSRFARLSEELTFRVGGISGLTLMNNVQAGAYLLVLDPDRHFLFTEFKGRLPNELVAEVKQLLRKWHPSDAAEAGAPFGQGASDQRAKHSLQLPRWSTLALCPDHRRICAAVAGRADDIFDLLDAWILIHRNLPLASNPENVAAVTNWARTLGTRAMPYFDGNRHGLGSTSICFRRTFWPFT